MFKYLVCPNEAACESKNLYPSSDGKVLKRKVDEYNYKMVINDVCSYIVHSPSMMAANDLLKIKITKTKHVDLYIAKGKEYRWINHLDYKVRRGDEVELDTKQGWNFYVVGVGND